MGILLAVLTVLEKDIAFDAGLPQFMSLVIFAALLLGLGWLCMKKDK